MEAAYIEFIEKTINAQLSDHFNNKFIFILVHAWNTKNECRFSYCRYFTEKTIIAKPLYSKFSNEEKQEILTWRNTLLSQVKSYIESNLYRTNVNVIY